MSVIKTIYRSKDLSTVLVESTAAPLTGFSPYSAMDSNQSIIDDFIDDDMLGYTQLGLEAADLDSGRFEIIYQA